MVDAGHDSIIEIKSSEQKDNGAVCVAITDLQTVAHVI